jgi:hypothetical protein
MKALGSTKKGNAYVVTGYEEIDKTNKILADKGKSILDQYDEPYCKHGNFLSDCFICD